MPVTYNDPRYTYNYGPPFNSYSLTYDGLLKVPLPAATQPAATGSLVGVRSIKYSEEGTQPAATGTLTYRPTSFRVSLQGTQPGGSASLVGKKGRWVTLTGDQPYPTGLLIAFHHVKTVLDGLQSSADGVLTQRTAYHVYLTGDQTYPSGVIGSVKTIHYYLEGFQPMIGLEWIYDDPRFTYDDAGTTYNGTTPGRLSWRARFHRLLLGEQPYSTGELDYVRGQWVWAIYHESMYDRPEEVHYIMSIDSDENLRYQPHTSGAPQGIVYLDQAIHRSLTTPRRP